MSVHKQWHIELFVQQEMVKQLFIFKLIVNILVILSASVAKCIGVSQLVGCLRPTFVIVGRHIARWLPRES